MLDELCKIFWLTLHVEVPSFPEIQMFLWSTLMGNWRAQAVLVIVSTVASLSTGEIPSAASLGFPQPEICMSRWYQVEFHSEYEGRQMGRMLSES